MITDNAFIVEGVDLDDGSRTELNAFDNSGDARAFLNGYTSKENAGGWDLIEVYDTRDPENPERLWFWERDSDNDAERADLLAHAGRDA